MKILKYLLVIAVLVFQIDFAQAGIKKSAKKAKPKPHIARSTNYYKAAKYFKAPKKAVKSAKHSKLKKGAKKRTVASVSKGKKKHLR